MRDKQFAAEMGETLETESKGEEMVVVEPPRVPLRPYKPNRGAIIILAFMFALVAGVGITQLIDSIDTSIRGGAAIVSVQGVPPLVEVPYIYTELEIARAMQLKKIALVSIAPVALILVVVLHFTVLPLDVLWYSIARRVGL
jgi:succinoglycan biosynthesis transport protein ExoP